MIKPLKFVVNLLINSGKVDDMEIILYRIPVWSERESRWVVRNGLFEKMYA